MSNASSYGSIGHNYSSLLLLLLSGKIVFENFTNWFSHINKKTVYDDYLLHEDTIFAIVDTKQDDTSSLKNLLDLKEKYYLRVSY